LSVFRHQPLSGGTPGGYTNARCYSKSPAVRPRFAKGGKLLRTAGAQKTMLISAAATEWMSTPATLTADKGMDPTESHLRSQKLHQLPVSSKSNKDPKDFRLIGK
jgi:hypothetical protein